MSVLIKILVELLSIGLRREESASKPLLIAIPLGCQRTTTKSLVIAAAVLLAFPATLHAAGEFTGLGFLPGGKHSYASGVSADGSAVVGRSVSSSGQQAFRWTQATRMQSIGGWLGSAGATLPAGWGNLEATAANLDGSVVVGNGISSAAGYRTGFRIEIPATKPVR